MKTPLLVAGLLLLVPAAAAGADFFGVPQHITTPTETGPLVWDPNGELGSVLFTVCGAQGGNGDESGPGGGIGGLGSRVSVERIVDDTELYQLYVGSRGEAAESAFGGEGGHNGRVTGGDGGSSSSRGGGGGGASSDVFHDGSVVAIGGGGGGGSANTGVDGGWNPTSGHNGEASLNGALGGTLGGNADGNGGAGGDSFKAGAGGGGSGLLGGGGGTKDDTGIDWSGGGGAGTSTPFQPPTGADCENSGNGTISITQAYPPVAEFSHPGKWPLNTEVQFRDFSYDHEGPVTWSWDFGDGGSSAERNPLHAYAAAGTYETTLTVTDQAGQTDTMVSQITIDTATLLDWAETSMNTASDAEEFDSFGYSVAIHGDTAIIGAPSEDTGGDAAGAAYIFTRTAGTWTQQAGPLAASNADDFDQFGWSVAIHGDTAIIGAPFEDDGGSGAGAAYIFTRTAGTWTQQGAPLAASNPGDGDNFGWSVAIHGDTAIIGAPSEDTGGTNAGAAYIFTRTGTTWTQQAGPLKASNPGDGDNFGWSVAIHGDTAIIGAPFEDTGGGNAGAAYIFTRTAGAWTQQGDPLKASNADDGDNFGWSVAIHGDTAIIGAHEEDTGGGIAGAAYIFTRTAGTWTQQGDPLTASNAGDHDHFGWSVAIHGDTAIIGAPFEDTGGTNAGAAYIFTRTAGTWTQQGDPLTASNAGAGDNFGISVAIHGDTAIIGALFEDTGGNEAGAAYFFELSIDCGPTAEFSHPPKWPLDLPVQFRDFSHDLEGPITDWDWDFGDGGSSTDRNPYHPYAAAGTYTVTLTVTDDEGQTDTTTSDILIGTATLLDWAETSMNTASNAGDVDQFGWSVAIHGDTAIISAPLEDTGGTNAGAAYIFTRTAGTWTQQGDPLTASNPDDADQFGTSVAIHGDTAIIGAPFEDTGGTNAGAAYIFTRTAGTWTQQGDPLTATNAGDVDQFGWSVAIHGDTAIIGAPFEDTGGNEAGAAYIFTRTAGTWTQQGDPITASNAGEVDRFGSSVAIHGDTAIIGAPSEDTGGSDAGAAYIFTRTGTTWTQQGDPLKASNADDGDNFGSSVAIHGDTAIISAPLEDTGGTSAGAAYIFTRTAGTWTQQGDPLTASNADDFDQFGWSVAIHGDTAIISAPFEDTGGPEAGAAYIFTRTAGTWTQQGDPLTASNAGSNDSFGWSVAIHGDTAIISAPFEDTGGNAAGAAYFFELPVNCLPTAAFTWDAEPQAGHDTGFFDHSMDKDGSIDGWEWDFDNDGTTDSEDQNPTWNFPFGGTFPVTLTVTDDDGATGSVTMLVEVAHRPSPGGGGPQKINGFTTLATRAEITGTQVFPPDRPLCEIRFDDGGAHTIYMRYRVPSGFPDLPPGYAATPYGLDLEITPAGPGSVTMCIRGGLSGDVVWMNFHDGEWRPIPATVTPDGSMTRISGPLTEGPFSPFVLAYGEMPMEAPPERAPPTSSTTTSSSTAAAPIDDLSETSESDDSPGLAVALILALLAGLAVAIRRR